jgi:hypothetical protein
MSREEEWELAAGLGSFSFFISFLFLLSEFSLDYIKAPQNTIIIQKYILHHDATIKNPFRVSLIHLTLT